MRTDQHASLVQFLEDHQNLDSLLDIAPLSRQNGVIIFEPCLFIGNRSKLTIGQNTRLDSFTKFEIGLGLHIGQGVHIASFAHVGIGGGETYVGDYCAIASGGKLISGSNQLDKPSMSPLAFAELKVPLFRIERKFVTMHNFSCVLTNSIVYPNVTLGFGAVLMPNSTATKDIPDWEVWGGSPAKFLFKREVK